MSDIFDFFFGGTVNTSGSTVYYNFPTETVKLLSDTYTVDSTDNVFVKIDNEMKCSTVDLYYINVKNISELNKYKDIDGLYKIEIQFVDGRITEFEYLSEDNMVKDYELLLGYFKSTVNGTVATDESDTES